MFIGELIDQLQKVAKVLGGETRVLLETEGRENEIVSLSFRKGRKGQYELIIEGVSFYFYKD